MVATRRAAAATVSDKNITDLKVRDDEAEQSYEAQIVYLQSDPHRAAAVEKRRYEQEHPESVDWSKRMPYRSHAEFGGAWGVTTILVFSHFLIWYFTLCLQLNQGDLILPKSLEEITSGSFSSYMWSIWKEHATPTVKTFVWYLSFLAIQAVFALTLPGIIRLGEPLPSLQGRKLPYICNAIAAYWVTFISFGVAHYYGLFDYTEIIANIAPLATTVMIVSDLFALAVYFNTFGTGTADPNISGNFFYDYFIGVVLNPRLGKLDFKMFFEVRVSWIMMTMITTSAALKFYQLHGYLSNNIIIITTGISIYAYSCCKGEHLILPTWDITTELYGGMLIFWNANLPFLYSAQSVYIMRRAPEEIAIPDWCFYIMMTILLGAYYCFDTVNSQKNTFRQMYNGTFEPRPWAIPSFAFGTIENPKYLLTKSGSPLLISGWYAYARKWQYTCDITMGLMWCLSAGFNTAFIPKFYWIFFVSMLMDRRLRDEEKCKRKYGKDWDAYCKIVPYVMIPGLY